MQRRPCIAVSVTLSLFEVTGVAAKVAAADAMFVMLPLSRSSWMTAYVAVPVVVSPGDRALSAGSVTVTIVLSSVTVNGPASVTLPVLVRT